MKLKIEVTIVPEFGDSKARFGEHPIRVFRALVSEHGDEVELKSGKNMAAAYDRFDLPGVAGELRRGDWFVSLRRIVDAALDRDFVKERL